MKKVFKLYKDRSERNTRINPDTIKTLMGLTEKTATLSTAQSSTETTALLEETNDLLTSMNQTLKWMADNQYEQFKLLQKTAGVSSTS